MKSPTTLTFSLFLAFLLSSAAGASETPSATERSWPTWRGPHSSGVAPHADPPVEWSESENVRWKTATPGRGLSTPIIWGDTLYLTTAVPTDKKVEEKEADEASEEGGRGRRGRRNRRRGVTPDTVMRFALLAIDRRSGKTLWEKTSIETLPHEGHHGDASWASSSPVTDGEYVLAYFGSPGLFCYDMKGKLRWQKDLGDMKTRNGFGEGSSPALYGEHVIVAWDHEGPSFIVALDRNTGKEIWRQERDEPTSWATPLVVEHEGKPQVVVSGAKRIRGYDLETGKVLWESGGMTLNTVPTPIHDQGVVYLTSGFRGSALRAIRLAGAKGDVTDGPAVLWKHDRDTPYVPSPLLYEERLYFFKVNTSILSCLDGTSGNPLYTQQRLEKIREIYASPVGARGRVYVVGRNGTACVLASGPEFKVLSINSLDDRFDASPAIAGNSLYLRGHESLYCLARDEKSM